MGRAELPAAPLHSFCGLAHISEGFFPRYNVRYSAIPDGADSVNRQEMAITPCKKIRNGRFSRDISKKVLVNGPLPAGEASWRPYGLHARP